MKIPIARNLLESNDAVAARLREDFAARGILTLNLISSPGSGKTSVLERTLTDLRGEFRMAVIEGDLQTDNDARRIAATGAQVADGKSYLLQKNSTLYCTIHFGSRLCNKEHRVTETISGEVVFA